LRLHQTRVQSTPGVFQNVIRFIDRQAGAVGAGANQRNKGVGQRDDARIDQNVLALAACGGTRPVKPLRPASA